MEFEQTLRAKIKSVRSAAYGREIADGHPAATATRSADKICRAYWRGKLRAAEERKHILARTMRRILEKEGAV